MAPAPRREMTPQRRLYLQLGGLALVLAAGALYWQHRTGGRGAPPPVVAPPPALFPDDGPAVPPLAATPLSQDERARACEAVEGLLGAAEAFVRSDGAAARGPTAAGTGRSNRDLAAAELRAALMNAGDLLRKLQGDQPDSSDRERVAALQARCKALLDRVPASR